MSGAGGEHGENRKNERHGRVSSAEINRVFELAESHGVRWTLALVLVSYFLYLSGWMEAFIPPEKLTGLIGDGLDTFVRESNAPTGWQWLGMLGYSDMLSLGALVSMVGVIFVAYLMALPVVLRRRDTLYLVLVCVQLVLFIVAGMGGPGGH